MSSDGGEILWYGEPHFQSGTITGTFRHKDCKRFGSIGSFVNSICSSCNSIPKTDSFRLRLQRRTESNVSDSTFKQNRTVVSRCCLIPLICQEINCYKNLEKPKKNLNAVGIESLCWVRS